MSVSVCECLIHLKKFDLKRVFQQQHCDLILNENSNRASPPVSPLRTFSSFSVFHSFSQFSPFLTSALLCSVCPKIQKKVSQQLSR